MPAERRCDSSWAVLCRTLCAARGRASPEGRPKGWPSVREDARNVTDGNSTTPGRSRTRNPGGPILHEIRCASTAAIQARGGGRLPALPDPRTASHCRLEEASLSPEPTACLLAIECESVVIRAMMRNQMGYHLTAERDDELKRRQPVFGEQDCGSASDSLGVPDIG
jgi:hypothetical protein